MNQHFEHYRALANEAIRQCPEYPQARYSGKGVVICAGGTKYFTCAWVCASMLRRAGCRLPIEFWHLGPREVNSEMRELVAQLDVHCIDAHEVQKQYPARRLNGWELKAYAIIHSGFEEVLFLDADNVPLTDPSCLFESAGYKELGAVFWPDYGPLPRQNAVWELCGVPFRFEPSFESGQLLVHKQRCWNALQLTMHYNEHSDEYYKHTGGDKDTFHLAWRRLEQDYAMTGYAVRDLGRQVMCQHDFDGRRIFQHRNLAKWTLPAASNPRIDGFMLEAECLQALEQLQTAWCGQVKVPLPAQAGAREFEQELLRSGRFVYHRVGYDRRELQLCPDQTIGRGRAGLEKYWHIDVSGTELVLCITSDERHRVTCALARDERGYFVGHWLAHERMPIELIPLELAPRDIVDQIESKSLEEYFRSHQFIALQPWVDQMLFEFEGEAVRSDKPSRYSTWQARVVDGRPLLTLGSADGELVHFSEDPDRVWRNQTGAQLPLHLIAIPASPSTSIHRSGG